MGELFVSKVKTVKIDGEEIYIFNSAIYIFESTYSNTLELEMIVSEVTLKKYRNEDTLIVEIELHDGALINSIMHVKILPGRLPQLHMFCEIDDPDEYSGVERVNENDSWFPNIEEGITIEDIRKVEMPVEDVSLKLKLPIDQVEWLKKQKKQTLNDLIKEMIYEHLKTTK